MPEYVTKLIRNEDNEPIYQSVSFKNKSFRIEQYFKCENCYKEMPIDDKDYFPYCSLQCQNEYESK